MSRSLRRIDLLPRHLLIKTGPVDEGAWYCHPLLRYVMRRRVRENVAEYFSEEHVLTYSPVPRLIPAVYRACRVAIRDRTMQGALVRAS
jgi:hypothetical protein